MAVNSRNILRILGYEVDNRGNVRQSMNQLAIVSLESTNDGGILRIHGDDSQFFYSDDPWIEDLDLAFPVKVTPQYVYFEGDTEPMKVSNNEFVDNSIKAFAEYNRIIQRKISG